MRGKYIYTSFLDDSCSTIAEGSVSCVLWVKLRGVFLEVFILQWFHFFFMVVAFLLVFLSYLWLVSFYTSYLQRSLASKLYYH
ncbi:hypothetical protein AAZX31_08G265300 [Glycine max]